MRRIRAGTLLITKKVFEDREATEASYRVASRIKSDQILVIADHELGEYLERADTGDRGRTGIYKDKPLVILDKSRWDGSDILIGKVGPRSSAMMLEKHGAICHDGFNIHTAYGCPNKCDYCCYGNIIYIRVDARNFVEHLEGAIPDMGPGLYKWDNRTDVMEFEPELGFLPVMAELFSNYTDKYLMVYTKTGDATELLKLEPSDQVIICWSASIVTQEQHMERGVALTQKRLEAASKCQARGHRLRLRISPIVPVRGWKGEIERLVTDIFEVHQLKPEIITLKALSFMPNLDVFRNMMGRVIDHLDPDVLQAMEDFAPIMDGDRCGPMNPSQRCLIYDHTIECIRSYSDVPISICHETARLWQRMSRLLPLSSDRCCCSNASARSLL